MAFGDSNIYFGKLVEENTKRLFTFLKSLVETIERQRTTATKIQKYNRLMANIPILTSFLIQKMMFIYIET